MTYHEKRKLKRIFLGLSAATPFSAISSPQDYNQLQYTIPFQTDDSYEAWSPTRPQAYYADPRYPGGLITQSGPIFNTRLRDPDEMDWEDKYDRFDGTLPTSKKRKIKHKHKLSKL